MKKKENAGLGVAGITPPLTTPVAIAPSGLPDQGASIANAPARRPLKFRAFGWKWSDHSGQKGPMMFYPEDSYFHMDMDGGAVFSCRAGDGYYSDPGEIQKHKELVIMQFTGLCDTNGREIYEGDIVDFTYWWFDGDVAESHLIGEIVYQADAMSFALRGIKNRDWLRHIGGEGYETPDTAAFALFTFADADFEVIGNVHENPELLTL